MPEAQAAAIPALGSPTFFRDPYRTYRALLDGGVRTVRLSSHIVAFTHYQDCLEILRDPRLSAKRYMRNLAHYTEEQRKGIGDWERLSAHMMIFMDAPDHTRVRKLLLRAFSPEALAAMLPRIEALFGEILDAAPAGVEVDFLRQVAHRFPPLVIGEILGVPHTHWRRLMEWSDAFIEFLATLQPPYELGLRANRAAVEMREYLRELSEEKRARPSDDLISFMLRSQEDGEALSVEEMLAQGVLLLVAGHETTRNLTANGLLTLLRHPAELERLRRDPSLMRGAVEEMLRFEGPLQSTSRVATAEIEYRGEKMSAGQNLLALVGCANRDGAQFPDPDRFDVARRTNPHLDFGAGAHTCLGLHLARLEAQVAFRMLLERYPRIELREEEPQWMETISLRALKRLNVVLGE